jgi:hypothetical protein
MEGCPQVLIHWTTFVSLTECRRCHMRVPCVISSGLILMIAVAGGFPLVVLVIPLARLGLPSCCSFLFEPTQIYEWLPQKLNCLNSVQSLLQMFPWNNTWLSFLCEVVVGSALQCRWIIDIFTFFYKVLVCVL